MTEETLESVVADLLDSVFDQQFMDDSGILDEERAIRYLKYGLAPVRNMDFTKGLCQLCGKGAHFSQKQEEGKRVWICLVCGVEYTGYLCEGCGSPMNKGEEIRSDGDPVYCKACYDDMTEKEKEEGFSSYRATPRYKCDSLCIRFMEKECTTESEDDMCDQPDMYREIGDVADAMNDEALFK